jgi:hypothetical protein
MSDFILQKAKEQGLPTTGGEFSNVLTKGVSDEISNPGDARKFGEGLVDNAMNPGVKKNTIAGAVGSAVGKELVNSPNLNTVPKIFLGFQQGGFGGGMQQLGSAISSGFGSLFGGVKTADFKAFEKHLPPETINQIGTDLQGSPAAKGGANVMAGPVNQTFNHLIDNSMFGSGLRMLASPFEFMRDEGATRRTASSLMSRT